MCGIAGTFQPSTHGGPLAVASMLAQLAHRGPDDAGTWHDPESGLQLGHRRLAVLDLSPAGHQPMASHTGRYFLVYNGEIYNFETLRRELGALDGPQSWRGHSDTEVLLAGFEAWGIRETVEKCNGMFAFAVWDRVECSLWLCRDRAGEKPLYMGWVAGRFAFASELSAFSSLPGWNPRLCREQASAYLATGYVQGMQSAIQGIFRLPPGSLLRLSMGELSCPLDATELDDRLVRYWSLAACARSGLEDPFRGTFHEAADALETLLSEAVSIRKVADVPVGAFLSGGIDSSLITALMGAHGSRTKTFSIGFDVEGYDEAPFARMVARHLGTDHSELYVDAEAARSAIPKLAAHYDEPFADQSAIPTFLVSELARKSVTVSLSGDAGDELFAGYGRYKTISEIWPLIRPLGRHGRSVAAAAMQLAARAFEGKGGTANGPPVSFRLKRLSERLGVANLDEMRLAYISGAGASSLASMPVMAARLPFEAPSGMGMLRQLMLGDQLDYLPDNILVKLDRASMAVSLESRVPFLDHRVIEFSWRLPERFLKQGGVGKLILREVLARHVPTTLFDRPKQGFAPPVGVWLRGPLKDWAANLLSPRSLEDLPVVDAGKVSRLWEDHLSGRSDVGYAIWNVLMLAAWRARHGVAAG